MNRVEVRQIVTEISSYNPFTIYIIDDSKLLLKTAVGMITHTQILLATEYEQEVVSYLQVAPEPGTCRNGHAIRWQCTEYGVWVCSCYFEERESIKRGFSWNSAKWTHKRSFKL